MPCPNCNAEHLEDHRGHWFCRACGQDVPRAHDPTAGDACRCPDCDEERGVSSVGVAYGGATECPACEEQDQTPDDLMS